MGFVLEAFAVVALMVAMLRPSREVPLYVLTAAALIARLAVGMGLYLISLWELPLFRDLQMAGGFWKFAIDAITYDIQARQVATYLAGQGELSGELDPLVWFFGRIYSLFGAGP